MSYHKSRHTLENMQIIGIFLSTSNKTRKWKVIDSSIFNQSEFKKSAGASPDSRVPEKIKINAKNTIFIRLG